MKWFRFKLGFYPNKYVIISHMGHTSDKKMHLEIIPNGRLYGKGYKDWTTGDMK